jgi:Uma2 family endonuclease
VRVATVQTPPRTIQTPHGAVQRPPAERVVLHNVSWRTYESLLADYPNCQAPRFAYDRGTLEIVVTILSEHEEPNRTLAFLIESVAAELDIDFRSVGGMTYRREEAQRGFEPDSSFYIQSAPLVRRRRIDPAVDPPPDLIIEIDVTSDSLRKFPLYAGLGIPEVWRYDGGRVAIHLLRGDAYEESATSSALPILTSKVVNRFLEQSTSLPRPAWLRAVRDWAQQQAVTERPTP